jgi:hypothetical protein
MYLFTRTRTAQPDKIAEARQHAVELAEMVKSLTGDDVNVFAVRFGAPMGTIMWSLRVESQAHLQANNEKMLVDSGYLDAARKLTANFEGHAVDAMSRFISVTPADGPSRFYAVTRASMAAGHYPAAIEFGVKVQQYVAEKLGAPTAFMAATYGGFADVTWTIGADTMAGIDAIDEMQMSDTKYQALVNEAGDLFVESSGMNSLVERLN